jgi:tripartite-type tricarboxylate transporter receptor subunit TctC
MVQSYLPCNMVRIHSRKTPASIAGKPELFRRHGDRGASMRRRQFLRIVSASAGLLAWIGPTKAQSLAGRQLRLIEIMFDPLQSVLSNVQAGKLRALAISSKTRSAALPAVPTIAESGYDGFETTAWWGVFGPAGMPTAWGKAVRSAGVRID